MPFAAINAPNSPLQNALRPLLSASQTANIGGSGKFPKTFRGRCRLSPASFDALVEATKGSQKQNTFKMGE
jgi:hypothetical protein